MRKLLVFGFILSLFFLIVPISHAQILTTEKLITVDIANQTLNAWENGAIINSTKVSTGRYYTPTVRGSFRIQRKIPLQDMRGNYPPYPAYYTKNVPNVMYFYGAYAIHGTYWHSSFGMPMSHGCVNVPVEFSKWIYDWAPAGTRVEVY